MVRTVKEAEADGVPLLSAGVTFYALLALPPALSALAGLYGLVADPAGPTAAQVEQGVPAGADVTDGEGEAEAQLGRRD